MKAAVHLRTWLLLSLCLAPAPAGGFNTDGTSLVVLRIGNGTSAPSNASQRYPIFLEEWSFSAPAVASSSNFSFVLVNTTAVDATKCVLYGVSAFYFQGYLSRSADNQYLTFGCVDPSDASDKRRVVARVDETGAIVYTIFTLPVAAFPNSDAVSYDGTAYWFTSSSNAFGTYYVRHGGTTAVALRITAGYSDMTTFKDGSTLMTREDARDLEWAWQGVPANTFPGNPSFGPFTTTTDFDDPAYSQMAKCTGGFTAGANAFRNTGVGAGLAYGLGTENAGMVNVFFFCCSTRGLSMQGTNATGSMPATTTWYGPPSSADKNCHSVELSEGSALAPWSSPRVLVSHVTGVYAFNRTAPAYTTSTPLFCAPGNAQYRGIAWAPNSHACEPGYFCEGNTSSAVICPGGFYCPFGSWTRRNCGRGHYCPMGSSAPTPCPYQVPPAGGWGAMQVQGPAFLAETAPCRNHCFWNVTSGSGGMLSTC